MNTLSAIDSYIAARKVKAGTSSTSTSTSSSPSSSPRQGSSIGSSSRLVKSCLVSSGGEILGHSQRSASFGDDTVRRDGVEENGQRRDPQERVSISQPRRGRLNRTLTPNPSKPSIILTPDSPSLSTSTSFSASHRTLKRKRPITSSSSSSSLSSSSSSSKSASSTTRRRKQQSLDPLRRLGWWDVAFVGVEEVWGGLWRSIFGEEGEDEDGDEGGGEDELGQGNGERGKGKKRGKGKGKGKGKKSRVPVDISLVEATKQSHGLLNPNRVNSGTGTTTEEDMTTSCGEDQSETEPTSSPSSSSSSKSKLTKLARGDITDEDINEEEEEEEWIDPVTRAPDTEQGLAEQLIGVNDSPPPGSKSTDSQEGLEEAKDKDKPYSSTGEKEVEMPSHTNNDVKEKDRKGLSFHLKSYNGGKSVMDGTNLESSSNGQGTSVGVGGSILTNPRTSTSSSMIKPSRGDSDTGHLNNNRRLLLASSNQSRPSLSSRNSSSKLLPNPLSETLLVPGSHSSLEWDASVTSTRQNRQPRPIPTHQSSSNYSFSLLSSSSTSGGGDPGSRSISPSPHSYRIPSARLPPHFHRPKILILDLDETLIHSTSRPISSLSSGNSISGGGGLIGLNLGALFGSGRGRGGRGEGHTVEVVLGGRSTLYHVYKRPYVDHFLKKAASWYTLVIFTASMQEYADPVIDWLDGGRNLFGKKLYRESCSLQPNGAYTKDLSIVEEDLSRVCFMDNSPISYNWNKANALPIEGWTSDPNDEALLDMLPVLDSLRFTSDVRKVLGIRGF